MKKVLYYAVLVLLPVMCVGIDQGLEALRHWSSVTFRTTPLLIAFVLANLLFIALVFWLSSRAIAFKLPKGWAGIIVIVGLYLASYVLFFFTPISPRFLPDRFLSTDMPHLYLAGAFWSITGLVSLFSTNAQAAVNKQ